jgi:hypothetical protein
VLAQKSNRPTSPASRPELIGALLDQEHLDHVAPMAFVEHPSLYSHPSRRLREAP